MRGLPLLTRLQLMGKAAVGLFDKNAATQANGLLAGIFSGTQGSQPQRGTLELLNTFNTSPWARACAMRVADAMSATHWRIFVQRKAGKPVVNRTLQKAPYASRRKMLKLAVDEGAVTEVTEHILLDLLRDGNELFPGPELWWLHSIWLDLIGDAFYMKQRNGLKAPETLWPIPPHWVMQTPTPQDPVYRISYRAAQLTVPQTEVLWAKCANPVNPYWRGSGLAKALDDELELDEFAVQHRKAFFRNNARPDLLVMPKEGGVLGDAERSRLEDWWTGHLQGYWRSYKPLFMKVPMDVKLLEQNFQQMQFSELRTQEADIILQVWGVPPELFGRVQNSNRATIDAALTIFGTSVLVPRLERQRHWIQTNLAPEYDQAIILDYDSPVPEDREFSLAVMKAQPSAFTKNEFRNLANQKPDDNIGEEYGQAGAAPGQPGQEPPQEPPVRRQPPAKSEPSLEHLTDEELTTMYGILSKAAERQPT